MVWECFEDALSEHLDMIYNLARRLSDSHEEAEDLVQETALAGWQAWQRHGSPDRFQAWMATVCLNLARSRYRRSRARPRERPLPDTYEDVTSAGRSADIEAIAHVQASAIQLQIAALPHHQREAVVMMDLCGFTASETAAILQVPRNTVLSRVHRGHRALAVLLLDWVDAR